MPEQVVRVSISEFRVAASPAALSVCGLGSCVVVAIYDPALRLGGLAHILLPGPAPADEDAPDGNENKYADRALPRLLRSLVARGSDPSRLVAKIAGGADMFFSAEGMGDLVAIKPGMGRRNVEAVKEQLARIGVKLVAEDVGGSRGRTVCFETATGRVVVSNVRGGDRAI